MKKILFAVFCAVFAGGICLCAAPVLRALQDMALRPQSSPRVSPEPVTWLSVDEDTEIAAYYLPPPTPDALTIIYSYGTLEDLQGKRHLLDRLYALGYGVIGYDYEGFGSSEGTVTLDHALRDVERVYRFLTEEEGIKPEKIVVSGYSMGSGPTSYLASLYRFAGVIIETGFASLYQVVVPFSGIPGDVFCNEDWLRNNTAPLLVLHGTIDDTVPVRNAYRLIQATGGETEAHIIEGANHCNIRDFLGDEEYFRIITSFLESLDS